MSYRYVALILFAIAAATITLWFTRQPRPFYADVAFGQNPEQRFGFVARGQQLYLDTDLTDGFQPTRYLGTTSCELPFEIKPTDGEPVFHNIRVGLLLSLDAISEERPQQLVVEVDVKADEPHSLTGEVAMSRQASKPGNLVFDQPFQIVPPPRSLPQWLIADGPPEDIRVAITTKPEDGNGAVSMMANRRYDGSKYAFRPGVGPEVEIEFASRRTGQPIVERFVLDAFC